MQKSLIAAFHQAGVNVLVSAFGATDYPTQSDPSSTCASLAQFVLDNNLDGVDIDYEDTAAFKSGVGEQWLISCTNTLRATLPQGTYLLTHAPQGPYFETRASSPYPNGAYVEVDSQVGSSIDWYNLQYYNQGVKAYVSYEDLFAQSSSFPGTAVLELSKTLHSKQGLAVGKPVKTGSNGFVDVVTLTSWLQQAQKSGWCGGAMIWQYASDSNGEFGRSLRQVLNQSCILT